MSFKIKWQKPEGVTAIRLHYAEESFSVEALPAPVSVDPSLSEITVEGLFPKLFYRMYFDTPQGTYESGMHEINNRFRVVGGVGSEYLLDGTPEFGFMDKAPLKRMFPALNLLDLRFVNPTNPVINKIMYRGRVLYITGGPVGDISSTLLLRTGLVYPQHATTRAALVAAGHAGECVIIQGTGRYRVRFPWVQPYDNFTTDAVLLANKEFGIIPGSEFYDLFYLSSVTDRNAAIGLVDSGNPRFLDSDLNRNTMAAGDLRNSKIIPHKNYVSVWGSGSTAGMYNTNRVMSEVPRAPALVTTTLTPAIIIEYIGEV